MSTKPTVLIIGGGIGGLALGQMLRKYNIPFRIFDRDASATARSQGWCMTLHWVVNDLKAEFPEDVLPLLDNVSHLDNYSTTCDAALYNGATGQEYVHFTPSEDSPFIRADRAKLREMLRTNLTVEYNKQFEHYEETDTGVIAFFSDGTWAKGDILVGADGAHSHVRKQLLGSVNSQNYVLPMEVCMGETILTKPQYEKIFSEFAKSWYAAETHSNFFCGLHSVSDDKETARYYWMTVQQKYTKDNAPISNVEYYQRAKNAVKSIQSKFLLPLYNTTPDGMVNPPISLQDFIPPKEGLPKGRVTLLGDSLHLMTPFKGSGGNLAIKDGIDLASLIANSSSNIPDYLQEYADLAIPRATELVLDSRRRTEAWTGDKN
ncbi:6-hydroxynicotinate 3-monooxygenase [Talaromyces islandicus]|uniref:6-hydroxynicotinate 3-monooxygenase n=1 Tax=Talaromyces islandicus TaxID=28573 RepID=A0A0U1M1D1_TALIS|nr:6-hydroxynicotinate 3-monooxygenase [Talaromyces islandicus]